MSQNWKQMMQQTINITSCTVRLLAAYKSWVHIPTLPLLSGKCSSEAELDHYYWWHHAAVADWTVSPGSNIMFKYLWMSALMHLVCMINYALLSVCVRVCAHGVMVYTGSQILFWLLSLWISSILNCKNLYFYWSMFYKKILFQFFYSKFHFKRNCSSKKEHLWRCTHPQAIQDRDEFAS